MKSDVNCLVAFGNADWENKLVAAMAHPSSRINIIRRCVDASDLQAAVDHLSSDVVVLSNNVGGLTGEGLADIADHKVRIVAVTDQPHDVISRFVEEPLSAQNQVNDILKHIVNSEDIAKSITTSGQARGLITAVLGFGGSTGRTTFLRSVGAELAHRKASTVLVEGDTFGPSLIQEMSLDVNGPTLLELMRAVELGRLSRETFLMYAHVLNENLAAVPGILRTSRWTDLRHSSLVKTWGILADFSDHVLIDCGPVCEADQGASHSTSRRLAVPRSTLEAADHVVVSSGSSDVHIARTIRQFVNCEDLLRDKSIDVVVWGEADAAYRHQIADSLYRHAGLTHPYFVAANHLHSQAKGIARKAKMNSDLISFPQLADHLVELAELRRNVSTLATTRATRVLKRVA